MSDLMTGTRLRRLGALVTTAVLATSLAACSSDDGGSSGSGGTEVKLGYFPNVTHASAIVGIDKGYFEKALSGDDARLQVFDFNSGSDVITQLQAGGLDASYIGPSPAITAYAGDPSVSIISGATSGGASLMVSADIETAADLDGTTLATPGPANTQDVALKYWLHDMGYDVDAEGKGDVSVVNQDNSITVQQFASGDIDGAWVPEPYASLLENEGATRLVDESTLWPGGRFVTTHLLVRNDFLNDHPDLVSDLLEGQITSNDYIADHADDAKALVGGYITDKTGGQIPTAALDQAWSELEFTNDPIADTFMANADHATANGQLDVNDNVKNLSDIYDLDPLNALLAAAGEPEVPGPSQ